MRLDNHDSDDQYQGHKRLRPEGLIDSRISFPYNITNAYVVRKIYNFLCRLRAC